MGLTGAGDLSETAGKTRARQSYSSPVMQERRSRILQEARALLAEHGPAGFNIRELSRRAGVSSRTLYHAYGDREGILAHALAAHIEELRDEWAVSPLGDDIDQILMEFDRVAAEIERTAAYTRTLVELYYSLNPLASALASIRSLPANRMVRWLAQAPAECLLPGLDRARVIDQHVDAELGAIHRWAVGRVPTAQLADEMRAGFLSMLLAITRGEVRDDVARRFAMLMRQLGCQPDLVARA